MNYDRIMLSPVLSGEKSFDDIIIHGDGWYIDHGVMLYKGHRIVEIDREAKTVASEHGEVAAYDKLVIATGSVPFIIPVPGHDLAGVLTYRDLDDVHAMMLAAQSRGKAVVIGGGLLGLEAAAGLQARGMDVTVLHLMPTLMERQLDPSAGYLLEKELESPRHQGHHQGQYQDNRRRKPRRGRGTRGRHGHSRRSRRHGRRYPPQCGAGEGGRPGRQSRHRRLRCDADLRSRYLRARRMRRGRRQGLRAGRAALPDGQVAAGHLAGDGAQRFADQSTATRLKVTGIDLYSAGDFAEGEDREEIVLRDASAGIYKRLVLKDNRIVGAVLYGDAADGPWFFDLLKRDADVTEMRDTLIFGQAYQGGDPLDPMAAVAALPDDAEICGCNGVCKAKIVGAISEKGLTTLDDVRAHTKASNSCGTCTGLVEQLMTLTLGDRYNPAAVQPMCACTDLGHDDVRRLIMAKKLKSIPAVMQELEWKTSCGCAKCRPALNYYLVCDWPDEYDDDYQSRFINERVHANIQKDGTYSVVPRMWGGVTSPTNCAPSPTSSTSSTSRPSRSPAASASTCSASGRKTCPPSGPISQGRASFPVRPTPRACAR